jgi:coenzyme F420-reducing hydrogenase delta subunit
VNIPYLVKAFETGADGVVVLTCEMDECRHLEGNRRAKKRAQAVDSLLDEIGMGTGRIAVLEVRAGEQKETTARLKEFSKKVGRTLAAQGDGVTK